MLEIGSLVDGKYKILNKIGQGGMSMVYLAMNERANKQWAVKEVRKEGVQNFEVVRHGLAAETDLLKKLKHSNLPSIVDVIDENGSFLIVMDYIEGRTLESILKEYGAQKQEDVVEWAKQLCDVLAYLHSRKPPIIYRDMKPANIMLKPDGKIMLIDFGAAREFKASGDYDTTCLGTRGYAAPEQYGGCGQTDERTDIYCLGATLYHLLTGHNPGEAPYKLYPIRYWNAELSSGLEKIVFTCTQKNPEERYTSCEELLYALEHYQELDIEYRQKQKSKWQGFLVVVILTILTGTGAVGFKMAGRRLKENTYEAYIDAAEDFSVIDPMECIKYYANAAALNPKEGTAYENILNFYMWRNNEERGICDFSIEEEQNIRKVLGISGNAKRSNETYFKENKEAYERFAYKLGLAYFYSYDGTGNKATSRKWLKIAADAEADMKNGLSEDEIQRAEDLYKIADYYDSLGVRNQAGDAMISYSDYWDDLVQMSENSGKDRAVNALLAYKEMTAQIVMNASYFKSAGISEGQMKRQLLRILGELERLEINAGDANADYEREMKMELKRAAELAEQTVFSTFNSANLEENVRKNEENGRNSKND